MNYITMNDDRQLVIQPASRFRNTCFYITSTIVAMCMIAITVFLSLLQKKLVSLGDFTNITLDGITAAEFNEMILCIQSILKMVCHEGNGTKWR